MSETTQEVSIRVLLPGMFQAIDVTMRRNGLPEIGIVEAWNDSRHPLFASADSRSKLFSRAVHQRSVAVRELGIDPDQACRVIESRERLMFDCLNVEANQEQPDQRFLYHGIMHALDFRTRRKPTHIFATPVVTDAILAEQDPNTAANYLDRMLAEEATPAADGWVPLIAERPWLVELGPLLAADHSVQVKIARLTLEDKPLFAGQAGYERTA